MVHVPNRSSDGIVEHLVFKCIKEDLLFSRDLINTMSSRIMFTNVSHSIDICCKYYDELNVSCCAETALSSPTLFSAF